MKIKYAFWIFIAALIIAVTGCLPAAADKSEATLYIDGILEFNLKNSSASSVQDWIDTELTKDAGNGSEWYVIALSNYGEYDFSGYTASLNVFLAENETGSASTRLKYALALFACGDKSNPYINKILSDSIGEQGVMSLVFGLHLLNNGCECYEYTESEIIGELLSLQLTDGGWAVSGEFGDVDVTAMTVQALAPHYDGDSSVRTAVDGAVDFLSARQNENGGYSSYGISNPESVSQVIVALTSLGIDVASDSRFIKNGNTVFDGTDRFRLPDGSFSHKEGDVSNSTATVQVFIGAIAYENFKKGKTSFYVFAENETVTESITAETQTTVSTEKSEETSTSFSSAETEEKISDGEENHKPRARERFFVPLIIVTVALIVAACIVISKKSKKNLKVTVAVILILTAGALLVLNFVFSERDTDIIGTVTITVRCDTVKDSNKKHIPSDGVILDKTEVEIKNNDTVYDVLTEICKNKNILISSNMTYIEGINNLYEMDFGDSSGWLYFVNGVSPSVGCGAYELCDGDEIGWHYTCDLGEDLTAG